MHLKTGKWERCIDLELLTATKNIFKSIQWYTHLIYEIHEIFYIQNMYVQTNSEIT